MVTNPPKLKVALVDDERLQNLKNAFERQYGGAPLFYACAPGRVNLIGEHIDYCGFSVLPMAIEQNILAAVSVNNSGTIQLANVNPLYNHITVSCSEEIVIDRANPKWYYYFLCGVKGLQEKFGITRLPGMSCVVDGNIPPSSGLSSSSALVCCAGLVTMEGNQQSLSKVDLAEICAKCECYIGTEGGGMDQSISFLAEKGTMLAKAKGLNQNGFLKLAEVPREMNASLEEMLALVDEVLHPEPYSREEICKALGITSQQFSTELLSANTQHVTNFKLHQRAKHVYGEAARVLRFKSVCDCAPTESIQLLGDLMNQSHASCRDLYECSCPELDQLVDICLKAGAVGSRLTGAGWGGCAVSMVPCDKVPSFLQAVREAYYLPDPRRAAMEKQSLFVSKPGGGAAIYLEK
ncbi:N-acetylgalactosamine kinase isoform X3 [Phycodurus eques]|uniref:N-acetylgalactosamine kinase isoform X3 n=1 Tax=Phycodurus eques TaxID=693459 RepID=UPI002ACDE567|nr:N-acetylgalactosamine kinase isoform X3 [Phycodurus eques]